MFKSRPRQVFLFNKFYQMKLKSKILNIEAGNFVVLINEEDAKELGICLIDRVEIYNSNGSSSNTSAYANTINAIPNFTKIYLNKGEIGIYEEVRLVLNIEEGDVIDVSLSSRPASLEYIRKKIDGIKLNDEEIRAIISDIVKGNLSSVELAGFVIATYVHNMDIQETISLINAMVGTGEIIDFGENVVDKHSIGGIAGNRTTMLLVPIIASANLKIPKTSSRAITSASGTADTMEVLAKVEFDTEKIKDIVKKANGCIVWGGAINLAPADDKIIKVEYPLSIDPDSQMLASVIAKKKSVNAKYLLVDIPVGRGAKITSIERGKAMSNDFINIATILGIKTWCLITDGYSPIGNGIGPALEARDVLIALDYENYKSKQEFRIPYDLINKSLDMAANIFDMAYNKNNKKGDYRKIAEEILKSKALRKMQEIVELQEGNPEIKPEDIEIGDKSCDINAECKGKVKFISNWKISQIARASGAPYDKKAGIYLKISIGDFVRHNDTLFTIYSSSSHKLQHAVELAERLKPVEIGGAIIEKIGDSESKMSFTVHHSNSTSSL